MPRRFKIIGLGFFVFCVVAAFYLLGPTNEIDNALGLHRDSMIECTQKWGQLAPFPNGIRNFTIKTEGNPFTRTFIGRFQAQPSVVEEWLKDSPGIRDGALEKLPDDSTKYTLKTREGASYGEVVVSADGTRVSFKVEWS